MESMSSLPLERVGVTFQHTREGVMRMPLEGREMGIAGLEDLELKDLQGPQ